MCLRNEANHAQGASRSSATLCSWFDIILLCPRLTVIPKLVGKSEVSGQISLVLESKGDELVTEEELTPVLKLPCGTILT